MKLLLFVNHFFLRLPVEDVPWAGRIFFSRCVESAVANPLLSKVAYHKFIFTEACRPNVGRICVPELNMELLFLCN